jgi:hypothetical protein
MAVPLEGAVATLPALRPDFTAKMIHTIIATSAMAAAATVPHPVSKSGSVV